MDKLQFLVLCMYEPIEMSFSMKTCGVQGTTDRVQISLRGMEHFLILSVLFGRYTTVIHTVGILSDSHGDAASPHQYCGHLLAFRIVV